MTRAAVFADTHGPVGIFDSGVGGLTVMRQIRRLLPEEDLVYLGDTARVPYGTKSPETVIRYARHCAEMLTRRGIKLLVVACNTASAYALDALRSSLRVPVIGVVEPGARAALRATRSGRIGVIGTPGTVRSGAYERVIHEVKPRFRVFLQACPLFVSLAEEGWIRGKVPALIAEQYLERLKQRHVDTLVLGCTHYPLLRPVIAAIMGPEVTLVDSAQETARETQRVLVDWELARPVGTPGKSLFLVTDDPKTFARTGSRFWGHPLEQVEWVDLDP
ncbi:MAG TPA: glutamate racemase [Candidatus Hydrogenedentes bacterium]|nr:glutamate racemase [Candidatus Hydrogenedentota bacterium]